METLTIDLGGTMIKMAVVRDGKIVNRSALPANSQKGLAPRLTEIEKAARKMIAGYNLSGAGISFPGIVNSSEMRVLASSGKYSDACGVDLAEWCRSSFGLDLVMENDANAALVGEVAYGVAQGYQNAVLMILGTGVGTAAMMNGHLIRGQHFQAGCLGGHFNVPFSRRICGCGHPGCLEANASGWALPELAYADPEYTQSGLSAEKNLDFVALEKWCARNDALANRLLDNMVEYWGSCIANMILAYDPSAVILSGGVMKFAGLFERIRLTALQKAWTSWGQPDFMLSMTPEDSVLFGLHRLVAARK